MFAAPSVLTPLSCFLLLSRHGDSESGGFRSAHSASVSSVHGLGALRRRAAGGAHAAVFDARVGEDTAARRQHPLRPGERRNQRAVEGNAAALQPRDGGVRPGELVRRSPVFLRVSRFRAG